MKEVSDRKLLNFSIACMKKMLVFGHAKKDERKRFI